MGGADKALAVLGDQRMIDLVLGRLRPQVGKIFLAAREDYNLGLPRLNDHPDFRGPCAGVLGAALTLEAQTDTAGFVTVPVDGPFLPENLVHRLAAERTSSAIARDDAGVHATFAYWTFAGLRAALENLEAQPSLRRLAALAGAHEVVWPGSHAFRNINTHEDLAAAQNG
jgi:molybdopterin-guanine dinucleotide biosynthesis protein A